MRPASSSTAAASALPYELRMAKGASAAISEVSSTRNSEKGSSTDRRSRKTLPYGSTTGIATSSAIATARDSSSQSQSRTPGRGKSPPPFDLAGRNSGSKFRNELYVLDVLGMFVERDDNRRLRPRLRGNAEPRGCTVGDHLVRFRYIEVSRCGSLQAVPRQNRLDVAAPRDLARDT